VRVGIQVLAGVIALAGCGRIGFDPTTSGGGSSAADGGGGSGGDGGSTVDAPAGVCVAAECTVCEVTGETCNTTDGCCACTGTWVCATPNLVDCPATPPNLGSGCGAPGLQCEYCPYAAYECVGTVWMVLNPPC